MFSRATSAVHLGWLPCGRVKANDLHRQTSLTGTASGMGRLRPVPAPDAHAWNAADIDTPAPTEPVPSALRFHPTLQVQRVDELAARLALALRDNAAANRTMYTLSSLGDDGRIWIVVSFVEAARSPRPLRTFTHAVAWLGVESFVVNKVIKRLVRRARPVPLTEHEHPLRIPRDSSFPSGHAASAATMATILWRRDAFGVAYVGLAGAIGMSRVHVGVHHGSDVVAGWIVGWAFGALARRDGTSHRRDGHDDRQRYRRPVFFTVR